MIKFLNISKETPYIKFQEKYNHAFNQNQTNIEAIAISSYDSKANQVDSRFVNLKFIDRDEFIFFTNYNSPKSIAFSSHDQISALIYWASSNTQIRMKAKIKKTSREYNNNYFKNRAIEKNALSISSNQSKKAISFKTIKLNYEETLESQDLYKCPDYWGGFSFVPYEIEFWEGNRFRLNKRDLYTKNKDGWDHAILEP